MAKPIMLGLLLAMTAVLLVACEVEEEGEEPGDTAVPATATVADPTPFATHAATTTPAPAGEPGDCPTPERITPADFAEPPRVMPAEQMVGLRLSGGVTYSQAHFTLNLPEEREFIINSAWSKDEGSLVVSVYDTDTASALAVRGDGCEISRFVRDAAADAVFDEMIGSLRVGSTYVCPVPARSTPADLPVPDEPAPEGAVGPWRVVEGGEPFQLGPLTLHLPAGRQFRAGGGISDPGGEFFTVTDVETASGLSLRSDGCENSRFVRDPAADAILDEIVRTLEVAKR